MHGTFLEGLKMRIFPLLLAVGLAAVFPAALSAEGSRSTVRARLMTQTGHSNPLGVISSISPDGRLVATGDPSVLKIWSTEMGRLVCELKPQRTQAVTPVRESAGGSDEADERDGIAGDTFSFAWSADGLSLYVPISGNRLARFDLPKCALAETLVVRLPDPRRRPRKPGDPLQVDNDIEQVTTLQNGRILIRTPSGLFSATIDGRDVQATALADLDQEQPDFDPGKIGLKDLKDILSGKATEKVVGMMMEYLKEYSIGAHSLDGKVVALTARSITLGPMIFPMSTAEVLISMNGRTVPLSSFQGVTTPMKGISVVAVSADGRWIAARSPAKNGATISLFNAQERRFLRKFTVEFKGGVKLGDSPISGIMQPAYDQDTAVAGMAFSPDGQYLMLLRNRRDAGEKDSDDTLLEFRRINEIDKVAKTIHLKAYLPLGGGMARMVAVNGSALIPSADQRGFIFQGGATMVAGMWSGDTPLLSAWRAAEGSVDHLVFEDTSHLVSTHSLAMGAGDKPISETMSQQDILESVLGSLGMSQHTMRWSLSDGNVSRVRSGISVIGFDDGPNLDRPRDGKIFSSRPRVVSAERAVHELVLEEVDSGKTLWVQQIPVDQGRSANPSGLALAPDQKLAAVLVHFTQDGPGSKRPKSYAGQKDREPTTAAPERGGLLGGCWVD